MRLIDWFTGQHKYDYLFTQVMPRCPMCDQYWLSREFVALCMDGSFEVIPHSTPGWPPHWVKQGMRLSCSCGFSVFKSLKELL